MNKLQLAEENHQSQNFIKIQIRLLENTRLSRPNTIQFNGLVKHILHFIFFHQNIDNKCILKQHVNQKGQKDKKKVKRQERKKKKKKRK